jgi:hypothetical protein
MAAAAGVEMPQTHLFMSAQQNRFFGIKRFDRVGDQRFHMHSLSGLLHADHRFPSLDYKDILRATFLLTKDMRDVEKAFRLAVFNVFAHNRDDHAKNFSFIMDQEYRWHFSPAYDLTFSSGSSGEHATTIMGEGKRPTIDHLIKLGSSAGLTKNSINDMTSPNQMRVFLRKMRMGEDVRIDRVEDKPMRELLGISRKLNEDDKKTIYDQSVEEEKFLNNFKDLNVNVKFEELEVFDNLVFWGGTVDGIIQFTYAVTTDEATSHTEFDYLPDFSEDNPDNLEIISRIEGYYNSFFKYWQENVIQ